MAGSMSDPSAQKVDTGFRDKRMDQEKNTPARPVLAASIAVFRDGAVLLIQRAKPPAAGLYSLPGGRVERGETMAAAALRELEEETGLVAEMLGFVDHVEHIERDAAGHVTAHAVICAFAGLWQAGDVTPSDEVADWVWVNPLAPPALPMTKGLPAILLRAARMAGQGEKGAA